MLYRALSKTHHMTSRKKLAAIRALTRKHGCRVYLKKGLRPPAVLVAEKYKEVWKKDGEDGEDGEEKTGETVLREWVREVKRLRYKQFQLLGLELVEGSGGLKGKTGKDRQELDGRKGEVREFDSLKELAVALQECGVLEWWRRHMFGVYDSEGLKDKSGNLGEMD